MMYSKHLLLAHTHTHTSHVSFSLFHEGCQKHKAKHKSVVCQCFCWKPAFLHLAVNQDTMKLQAGFDPSRPHYHKLPDRATKKKTQRVEAGTWVSVLRNTLHKQTQQETPGGCTASQRSWKNNYHWGSFQEERWRVLQEAWVGFEWALQPPLHCLHDAAASLINGNSLSGSKPGPVDRFQHVMTDMENRQEGCTISPSSFGSVCTREGKVRVCIHVWIFPWVICHWGERWAEFHFLHQGACCCEREHECNLSNFPPVEPIFQAWRCC